ncbi:MAG: cytosolic protein [Anaerolineae bacterium]|nr:cytosolic protein [Anaerolineae bacterium]
MNPLDPSLVRAYVNENIDDFHKRRINSLAQLDLRKLLTKNPYLFKAKNIVTAGELVTGLLEAFLSSSEEKLFGDFLEHLALFVAESTCNGHKSTAPGIDLEFSNRGVYYVVSIKSGPNWGNNSQQLKQEQDLRTAVVRVKQANRRANIQPVLGICYGKTRTTFLRGYMKVVGQNFWYLISDNKNLYTDIVEPIGYRAQEHNEQFQGEKVKIINLFTGKFISEFCDSSGAINWVRLVQYNSGNFDLDEVLGTVQ